MTSRRLFSRVPLRRGSFALATALALAAGCDESPLRPEPPTTSTIFYLSRLSRGGETWRSFTTEVNGTVTIQLTSLLPQINSEISLGLGTFAGGTCTITREVNTAPSAEPQISETLPAGSYCVRVADPGNLTRNNDFSITIVIPLR